MIETTYDNFIYLSENHSLSVGEEYRITDYVTKVKNDYEPYYIDYYYSIPCFRSAEHPFDIVLTATSTRNVSPYAKAMVHSGDTYFSEADLSQWSLYYVNDAEVSNGTSEILTNIEWAPLKAQGGKGAIIWMRDEHGNEAHYDFKNIQFLRKAIINPPSLRDEAGEKTEAFFTKIRSAYDAVGYTGANKGMTYHIWQGYIEESEAYSKLSPETQWGDVYTLEEEGTRIFCIMDYDSDGYIIAEVSSTDTWFYTFSKMQGNTITDASLDGTASNCHINIRHLETVIRETSYEDYYLTGSVIILQENETANNYFAYADMYYFNTHTGSIEDCEIDNNTYSTLFNNGWNGAISNAEYSYVLCKKDMHAEYVAGSALMDIIENVQKVVVKTLTFKSFDNKTYTIDIYGTSEESAIGDMMVEGNAVHLQENIDNDFFKSLRVQTGYLYLTNASVATLLQLIPLTNMQRPLVIKENGTLIWTGFLKPQQFNMQYTAMMYEKVNLPIACQLSMIKGEYFKPNTDTQYMSIGRIILLTIATIASNTPEPIKNICFDYGEQMIGNTQYVTGSDAWLQASISPAMFYKYKEDTVEAKIDMQKMMESLCTFLGFTCRTEGNTLYFMAMDDSSRGRNMRKVTYQQIFGIVNGVYATGTSVSITEKNIFGTSDEINRYAGTDNTMLMKEGVNKAIVNCEKKDHSLTFAWPNDEVANDFPNTSPITTYDSITGQNINVLGQTNSYEKNTGEAAFKVRYGLGSWYLFVYDPDTSSTGNLYPKATIRCNQPCYRTVTSETVHWTYQWNPIRVRTKNSYIFNNCIISVNFNLKFAGDINGIGSRVFMYVRIGNQYYRERSVTIDNSSQQIKTNREKYGGDANYSGYGFKIDSSTITNGNELIYGWLEVGIRYIQAYRYENGTYTFPAVEISDFTVQIVPNERLGVKYQDKYEAESSGTGKEYTKDTMFIKGTETSHLDNAVIGVDKFLSSTETDNNYNSCGYFAQRIANYYKRARRLYKVIVKRSMVNAKPTDIFVDSPDGAKYTPISIENDFRNDRQKILLAEIDN